MKGAHIWLATLILTAMTWGCSGPTGGGGGATSQVTPTETARLRFAHAITDAARVDVMANDTAIANVGFMQWGDWVEVPAGEINLTLSRGEIHDLNHTFTAEANKDYFIVAYGSLNPQGGEMAPAFIVHEEEDIRPTEEDTYIRFINAVTDGEEYSLVITTGGGFNVTLPNIGLGEVSEYKLGPVFENTFDIIPARNTALPAVTSFEYNLQVGLMYTFIVTGRASNGSLQVFTVTDALSLRG